MTKKFKALLENKIIYLCPYNDLTQELAKQINERIKTCQIIGFIDSAKQGSHIYTINEINHKVDNILIYSPKYFNEIFNKFLEKKELAIKCLKIIKKINNKLTCIDDLHNKKQIVCFGNCQASQIGNLLNLFVYDKYEIINYFNYKDNINHKDIINSIIKADVVIYQPLSNKYEGLSHENIQKIAQENNTKTITFPYIYNNGIYSLEFGSIQAIHGKEIILNLYKEGKTIHAILEDYLHHKIDFRLKERFANSLSIMKEREKDLDIQLCNFIESNYKDKKLFHCYNHPTNIVFFEILRRIQQILSIPIKIKKYKVLPRLATTLSPISPYDIAIHQYKFKPTYCRGWYTQGEAIIRLIISNYENEIKNV